MSNSIPPEVALATLRNLLVTVPDLTGPIDAGNVDRHVWLGKAAAVVTAYGSPLASSSFVLGRGKLRTMSSDIGAEMVLQALYDTASSLEMKIEPGTSGAFIPAGNALDAFAGITRVVQAASSQVLIVDPYLDSRVVTDFAIAVPAVASILLLADTKFVKPTLAPAVRAFKIQYQCASLRPA
jgi:hypothetical protein